MNFIRFVEKVFAMYAAMVGCQPRASMSADKSPYPWMDMGGNLRVSFGDALIPALHTVWFESVINVSS